MDDGRLHGYETGDTITYQLLRNFAFENKKHQTHAEELLWEELRRNRYKFKFRRQHIIDMYIADFICLKYKLIIEVDGGYHSQDSQQLKDAFRTEVLHNLGFSVIRFTNEQIEASPSSVADAIYNKIFEISESEQD